ncbi:DUF397 domain-containing protein [Streptomyces sp. NPDC088725]|uniref:DUF397 domain-containing protein n=1 Tax=Streptomyces sp. NPDC088725 TaxID=3365873 RepID=UPI0037F70009
MTTISSDLIWTKSSYSGGNNDCVEVALGLTDSTPVRDSKRPTGPALVVPTHVWTTFLDSVKTGHITS